MKHQIITIANTSIQQDTEGRFSLNDLHKAAGGEERHKPANFVRLDSTQALIAEIDRCSEASNALHVRQGGTRQGTYVVKELVYAYAMWISPKFHLQVIRTFDAIATGDTEKAERIARPDRPKPAITMTERQIRAARALLTGYAEDLKISKVSLAGAYLRLEEKAGLKGVLPHYVSEGPEADTKGSEPGLSATELLRRKGIAVSAQRFNQLLFAAGFIEEKTRPSSKGGEKRYWSVTDFKYGKNETSPSNPRETQPLWYESQFDELLARVMPNGPSLVVLA